MGSGGGGEGEREGEREGDREGEWEEGSGRGRAYIYLGGWVTELHRKGWGRGMYVFIG